MNGTKKLSILSLIICFSGFLMVGCVSRPDAGEADLSGGATHLQAVNATIAHAVAETGEPEGEETIYPIDLRSALRLGGRLQLCGGHFKQTYRTGQSETSGCGHAAFSGCSI